MKTKILYLSYNGMMEPLGASQVLSYLFKLSENYQYYLVSLEKSEDLANKSIFEKTKLQIESYGIVWFPLLYQDSLVGKRINLYRFIRKSYSLVKQEKISFIHCRSYFPALAAYLIKKKYPIKYLFDTRGFDIDERADVGAIKKNGVIYDFLKWLERKLYQNANGINKLSMLGKDTILANELFEGGNRIENISVIPTCVDLDRFSYHDRPYKKPITVGYVGTAIGWYDFDKTLKTLRLIAKEVDVNFLVFNGGQHEFIRQKISEYGIDRRRVHLEKVPFTVMPERLKEIDIALFFIHPYFSKRASAATKLGEFFASGIPVLTNAGVGDHEYLLNKYKTGRILDFDEIENYNFREILGSLLNSETSLQCRKLAEEYFSLDKGVEEYKKIYNKIF